LTRFAAIDFETANYGRNSACAVGITIVDDNRIIESITELIRPPSSWFQFTYIHGLTWEDVCDAPTFDEVWLDLSHQLSDIDFFAAHNAPFDQGVLTACCQHYGLSAPSKRFVCTVGLAREQWSIYPTKLPNVCDTLDIDLNHHDAGSDAEACARIVIAANKDGWNFPSC